MSGISSTPSKRRCLQKAAELGEAEAGPEFRQGQCDRHGASGESGYPDHPFDAAGAKHYYDEAYAAGWAGVIRQSPEHAAEVEELLLQMTVTDRTAFRSEQVMERLSGLVRPHARRHAARRLRAAAGDDLPDRRRRAAAQPPGSAGFRRAMSSRKMALSDHDARRALACCGGANTSGSTLCCARCRRGWPGASNGSATSSVLSAAVLRLVWLAGDAGELSRRLGVDQDAWCSPNGGSSSRCRSVS